MIIRLLSNGGFNHIKKCIGKQFYAKRTRTGAGVMIDMSALNAEGGKLTYDFKRFCRGELYFSNHFQIEYEVVKE